MKTEQLGSGSVVLHAPRADDGLTAVASTSITQRLRKFLIRFAVSGLEVEEYSM